MFGLCHPGRSDAVAPNLEFEQSPMLRVQSRSKFGFGSQHVSTYLLRNFLIPKTSSCFCCCQHWGFAMPLNLRAVSTILLLPLLGKRPTFIGPDARGGFNRQTARAARDPNADIYTAALDKSLADRLAALCLTLEKQNEGRFVSNCGGWQSRDLVGCKEELLWELMQCMHRHLANFQLQRGEESRELHSVADQLWANINRPGNFNRRHDHGTATASLLASGVFYCQCNGNAALRLYPEKEPVKIIPEPGMLVLFPPDMEHDVEALPAGAGERISIAFNLRARWLLQSWQRCAVEGKLQVGQTDLEAADPRLGLTALHLAAEAGHAGLVKQLLRERASPSISLEGWSPLGLAVDRGHQEVVDLLLTAPQPSPKPGAMLQTGIALPGAALRSAAFRGHVAILRRVLRWAEEEEITAAALAAAAAGQVAVLDVLVSDPNASSEGRSLLHQAAGAGHVEVVGRLLAANADLHFRDEHRACPLHEAAAKGHAAVVQQLVAARAAVGEVDCEGKEALHWAASKGHVEAAKVLLKANAQVGSQGNDGETPLHLAASSGHVSLAEILLDHGAAINVTLQRRDDIFGPILRTGNFWSRQRFADFLSRRTSAAVPAVAASERAGSVAHAAAAAGQLDVLQLLGERCDLDELVDEEGATLLHWAAANGRLAVLRFLLRRCQVERRDVAGSTALHDAAWGGHLRVAEVLLEAGAPINALDMSKQLALHAAVFLLMDDMVRMLLLHGADPSQRDSQGRRAQDLALALGSSELVELLEEKSGKQLLDALPSMIHVNHPLDCENIATGSPLMAEATNGANGANGEAETKPAELTEAEKFAARAKRWGLPETAPPTSAVPAASADEDGAKLAARAKRFGGATAAAATTGVVVEEDAEKLPARAKRWGVVTPEPEQPKTERRMRGRGVSKLHSDMGDGRPPEVQEAKQDLEAFLARKAAQNGRGGLEEPRGQGRRPGKGAGKGLWSDRLAERGANRGTKRPAEAAAAEPADPEEDERRKQRAQRFGLK
eukprot:s54_g14.t2